MTPIGTSSKFRPSPGLPSSVAGPLMSRLPMLSALALLGIAAGCASGPPLSSTRMAGVAPMLSVERFLQAANTRDLEAMARIFGTADGPIADATGNGFSCAFKRIGSWIRIGDPCLSWSEIELRMDAIAAILRHDDYRVRSESSVAGRTRPTTRIGVDLVRAGNQYPDVGFFVVQTSDGRWLVEQAELEKMTAFREPPRLRGSFLIMAATRSVVRAPPIQANTRRSDA